jgi:hypothetical protein
MFKNAKMFADHGNGCFTTKELLSIRLLSLKRDIGAPLKMYGKSVSLFKDAFTDRDALTTTFRHCHMAIKHFSKWFGMKGLYPTILTQPSSSFIPLNSMIIIWMRTILGKELSVQQHSQCGQHTQKTPGQSVFG